MQYCASKSSSCTLYSNFMCNYDGYGHVLQSIAHGQENGWFDVQFYMFGILTLGI